MKNNDKFVINERFSFGCDEYNWILYDSHKYKNKKGEIKKSTKAWYPSTLEGVCEKFIDLTPKDCAKMQDIIGAIQQAKKDCIKAISKIPYKHTHK